MIFVFNALFYARKVKTREDKKLLKLMHVFENENVFYVSENIRIF